MSKIIPVRLNKLHKNGISTHVNWFPTHESNNFFPPNNKAHHQKQFEGFPRKNSNFTWDVVLRHPRSCLSLCGSHTLSSKILFFSIKRSFYDFSSSSLFASWFLGLLCVTTVPCQLQSFCSAALPFSSWCVAMRWCMSWESLSSLSIWQSEDDSASLFV